MTAASSSSSSAFASAWLLRLLLGSIAVTLAFASQFESDLEVRSYAIAINVNANASAAASPAPLLVPLTLIPSAAAKGAVCLDGSLPGYHLDQGYGSGANSWLIELEGGGWCNDVRTCVYRKTTRRGSSKYMEKQIPFTGILNNRREENPDFYNWNRVRVRYCDGASFAGEGYNEAGDLYFRGHRIWLASMEDFMSKGMRSASEALLAGCSAGGLASIIHCDEFQALFATSTKVKCIADAGLFLDAVDVSGGHTMRSFYDGVVSLQGVARNLPESCTAKMDATSLQESLAPKRADPSGHWLACKHNHLNCDASQVKFLHGFRNEMLHAVKDFSSSNQNGIFINSCFAHCQSERQDTWYGDNSPAIADKGIAKSVGDWYFDRAQVKEIDCPYPCDNTCHNLF